MRLGRIVGKVVASVKDPSLVGHSLLVVQPIDHDRKNAGEPLIAADVVSAGQGETVYYVSAREACILKSCSNTNTREISRDFR